MILPNITSVQDNERKSVFILESARIELFEIIKALLSHHQDEKLGTDPCFSDPEFRSIQKLRSNFGEKIQNGLVENLRLFEVR
jgi:hypothetical protein